MPLLETILGSIAVPVAKFLVKQAFGETIQTVLGESALDLIAKQIPDGQASQTANSQFRKISEAVARNTFEVFEYESGRMTEGDLQAVALEVGQTVDQLLNTSFLIDVNLNPEKLEQKLKSVNLSRVAMLGEDGQGVYFRVLKILAPQLVALAPQLKDFQLISTAEILSQLDEIDERLTTILDVAAVKEARYEASYLNTVQKKLDEMELFGVGLPPGQNRQKLLKVAYISLNLNERGINIGAESLLDKHLKGGQRLLVIGDAGSGKSTLTRWISIEASRSVLRANEEDERQGGVRGRARDFDTWRQRIPFLVRLRDYTDGDLPRPEEIPVKLEPALGSPPTDWVQKVLRAGRGLIIFDGIDEVPAVHRDNLLEKMEGYFRQYENTPFLLSARPASIETWSTWLNDYGIKQARINPMSPAERNQLIRQWHESMRLVKQGQNASPEDLQCLEEAGRNLIEKLPNEPGLARLAEYPLICAVICALHYWNDQRLPEGYWELCNALCDMLIHKRDQEALRGLERFPEVYKSLRLHHKRRIAQHIALKMVETEFLSSIDIATAVDVVRETIMNIGLEAEEAEDIVRFMVERSGILRVPTLGKVEFIHNTFKEFLIAEHLIKDPNLEVLLQNIANPDWKGVIASAASSDSEKAGQKLIKSLLDKGDWYSELLAMRCRNVALFPGTPDSRFAEVEERLFPPSTSEEAQAISDLGNLAVDRLKYRDGLSDEQAISSVMALGYIDTDKARAMAQSYINDERVFDALVRVINPLIIPRVAQLLSQYTPSHLTDTDWRQQITKLEPLDNLLALERLNLRGTLVTDLTPLEHLTELTKLEASGRLITSLKGIENLSHLSVLRVNLSSIVDLSPIQNLSELKHLSISSNSLNDLSPVRNLKNLTRLFVRSPRTIDLSPLQCLYNLQILDLVLGTIIDIRPLQNLTNLNKLNLSSNALSELDLNLLQNLNLLKYLNLSSFIINDMTAIQHLTELSELTLQDCFFSDLSPLQNLERLSALTLQGSSSKKLDGLQNLTSLNSLYLVNSMVDDLSPLENLTGLKHLSLSGSFIHDSGPLENLTGLRQLSIHASSVSDLNFVQKLTDLKILRLRERDKDMYVGLDKLTVPITWR